MSVPNELAALKGQYDQLAQAFNDGHISLEDAQAALNSLSVQDGSGASWGIDIEGNFTRAQAPGLPNSVADASMWVPLAGPGVGAMPPGGDVSDLTAPPAFPTPGTGFGGGSPAMAGFSGAPGPAMGAGFGAGGGFDSGFEAPKSLSGAGPGLSLGDQAAAEQAGPAKPSALTGVVSWVSEHKVTAILTAFGVGLIGFAAVQFLGSTSDDASTLPPVSIEQGSTDGFVTDEEFDVEVGVLNPDEPASDPVEPVEAPVDGGETPQVAALPSEADVAQALDALGTSVTAGEAFVLKPERGEMVRANVVLAGVNSSPDVVIQTSRAEKANKANRATQSIVVVDTSTGDDLMGANVTWELSSGTWKLVRAPKFSS